MNKSWLLFTVLALLPLAAQAQIYKWKDSSGVVRYSDVPPASNIPHETLSGKQVIPSPAAPAAPESPAPTAPAPGDAAAQRQQSAEQEKAQQQTKDAQQQVRQQNCANAKSNMQKYSVGGRIMKVNEKGEREYLSDADIQQGLEQAKKEIAQFCDE